MNICMNQKKQKANQQLRFQILCHSIEKNRKPSKILTLIICL